MSRSDGTPTTVPATSFKVMWFVPDRPVEGNTVYVRPPVQSDAPTGSEPVVSSADVDS